MFKKYNPYYDKDGNPNLKTLNNELVFYPKPDKIRTLNNEIIYLTPFSNKGKVKIDNELYDFEINKFGMMVSKNEIPGYKKIENYFIIGFISEK